jgi:ubiquinone/menaquinone biosynthesis C-methylase UbiE
MKIKSPYLDSQMAEYYANASARHQFKRPAEDLVKWLKITKGEKTLDIGSGTGTVATAAWRAVSSSGFVVSLDSSIEMLKQQQGDDRQRTVGCAPELPFLNGVFDAVTVGFVLTHIPDYAAALLQIVRVLRPQGRLGATAWGSGTPRVSEVWKNVMEQFVNIKTVQEEFARIIPWDELFSERMHLAEAFTTAGFIDVETETNEYLISMQPQEYIATKIGSIEGTIVRNSLQENGWLQFLKQLLFSLEEQFPDGIQYTRNVHFVSGRKPRAR